MESRSARFLENHQQKYVYGSNTEFDEAELNMLFLVEIIRLSHPLTFNCLYALKYDFWDSGVVPLAEKGLLYNI